MKRPSRRPYVAVAVFALLIIFDSIIAVKTQNAISAASDPNNEVGAVLPSYAGNVFVKLTFFKLRTIVWCMAVAIAAWIGCVVSLIRYRSRRWTASVMVILMALALTVQWYGSLAGLDQEDPRATVPVPHPFAVMLWYIVIAILLFGTLRMGFTRLKHLAWTVCGTVAVIVVVPLVIGLFGQGLTKELALASGCSSPVGTWNWWNGNTVTFLPNGTATALRGGYLGNWSQMSDGSYHVHWNTPSDDYFTILMDGKSMPGSYSGNKAISTRRGSCYGNAIGAPSITDKSFAQDTPSLGLLRPLSGNTDAPNYSGNGPQREASSRSQTSAAPVSASSTTVPQPPPVRREPQADPEDLQEQRYKNEIAQSRTNLANIPTPRIFPSAMRRVNAQMLSSKVGDLERVQGTIEHSEPCDYTTPHCYYVRVRVTYRDGSVELVDVPWPLIFTSSSDPLQLSNGESFTPPTPPADYHLPQSFHPSRFVCAYFHDECKALLDQQESRGRDAAPSN